MNDPEMARLLSTVKPEGRDVLRRAMRAEQFERDELAERLLRERSIAAQDLADLIDLASVSLDVRHQLVRVLGELEARDL